MRVVWQASRIPGPSVISNADVKAIVGTVIGSLSAFLLCCTCYLCVFRAREDTKKGKANGNDTSFQTALLKKGESKSSTKDQHVLASASNIVTPNVVVMGPVSNITVTGGNAQQVLGEQPPKYEESSSKWWQQLLKLEHWGDTVVPEEASSREAYLYLRRQMDRWPTDGGGAGDSQS
jgi:hypothetical protein